MCLNCMTGAEAAIGGVAFAVGGLRLRWQQARFSRLSRREQLAEESARWDSGADLVRSMGLDAEAVLGARPVAVAVEERQPVPIR